MLNLIFSFCIDDHGMDDYTVCDDRHILNILSKVCSCWRVVMRSTIGFWTTLHFCTSAKKLCNAAITQHLLSLSRDMPLSLHFFTFVFPRDEENIQQSDDEHDGQASTVDLSAPPNQQLERASSSSPPSFEELRDMIIRLPSLSALASVAHRLKQLELDVTAKDFRCCSLVRYRDLEFRMLSTLSISVDDSREFDFGNFLEKFHNAPALQTLTIVGDEPLFVGDDGWPHMDTVRCSNFPWNQLTNLTLDIGIIAAEAREILCLCTALETAVFSKLADDPEEDDLRPGRTLHPGSTLLLPNLRELSIASDALFCCDLLERMWLPNLESLNLDVFHCIDCLDILRDLGQRSKFRLLHFSLCELDHEARALRSFLTQIPTLQELDLQHCSDFTGLIKYFTYPRSQLGLPLLQFPDLRVFTVPQPRLQSVAECSESLLKLVESLSHYAGGDETPCPVLETVWIPLSYHYADGGARIKEQLASVCANGFNIEYL
ncbi:hypothetical protein R3P38DRAFT_3352521 [Favolaschia claudopus]|uniref:F-box domain-containing protein n=1 Tax=Favolaschia claudopus TaxID=2862362 RepID=A0AAW0C4E8_9AGAR